MVKERKLDFQSENWLSKKWKGKLFIRTGKKKIVYKGRKKGETKWKGKRKLVVEAKSGKSKGPLNKKNKELLVKRENSKSDK